MQSSPVRLFAAGAVALMVLLLPPSGVAQIAPEDPGADLNAKSKENRRDPRRLLIPLHERPERPMLADTATDTDVHVQRSEFGLS